ncbi:MAG TPA: NADH-quinone oxidoreductase subunit N [Trueperaceae bacterium]|nr:NADH-quinone oxidoreductase subunit N [Trueperaceae bacterium]
MIDINWAVFAPALSLIIAASASLLITVFNKNTKLSAIISFIAVLVAAAFNMQLFVNKSVAQSSFALEYLADIPALGFNFVILIATALAILISYDYIVNRNIDQIEYYPLMLLSAAGALVMVAAGGLITLVLGLEIMSLAVYVLAAWKQDSPASEEAGMKYFLLGAFASAFLIYGIAMLFGATGSFNYAAIAASVTADGFDKVFYAVLASLLILVGLGFKTAMFPFHQWAPDVYTGAPMPVTAFMSTVVKTAAFAALFRIAASFLLDMPSLVSQILLAMIALTMIVGNLGGLVQNRLKRMLAFSAVAHAGYLGLALFAAKTVGIQAAIWYLTAYVIMNAGAFAVLSLIVVEDDQGDSLDDISGLAKTHPALAAALSIFLFSLAGFPLFAGFIGKILVFQAAIENGYVVVAVIGIITSLVAVVYYLRPIVAMYFKDTHKQISVQPSMASTIVIAVTAIATVLLGILPGWWYGLFEMGQRVVAGG